MLKLLIMSDIHYGSKYSLFDFEIIENELPNFIVLNGDIVDVPNLKLFAEFINEYASYFPISKTCILLGDNEYLNDSLSIAKYAKNLEIMNKELSFFTIGNMFFCHGNISNNIVLERLGIEVIKFSNKFNKEFIPKLASSFIRWRFNLNKDSFLFMGHLHYLNKIGNDVFCGTFKLNSLLYERNESLGFVRIITNHNFIVKEINLVHI
jgi:predicted phosphodiesterase